MKHERTLEHIVPAIENILQNAPAKKQYQLALDIADVYRVRIGVKKKLYERGDITDLTPAQVAMFYAATIGNCIDERFIGKPVALPGLPPEVNVSGALEQNYFVKK